MRRCSVIEVVLLLIISTPDVFCIDVKDKQTQIDSLMGRVHKLGIFNGSVLVVENGKTVYNAALGYADAGKKRMLTQDLLFNIGSIGKEFNAVAIMMLVEQGKLSLDDKISKFLPELPDWSTKISVLHLLQYTSGLPDISWKTIGNDADIYRDMLAVTTLNFEPGTNYAYNNSNVFLQRRIVEKITDVPFSRFVETQLLLPAGMRQSRVDPDMRTDFVARCFSNNGQQDERQFAYVMSGWTAVTASDLYKWAKYLHTYKLIDKQSFEKILIRVSPDKQSGLGGGRIENGVVKERTDHGSSFDFEAFMYTEPDSDVAVILLTNNMNFKLFQIKDAILNILHAKPWTAPRRSLLTAFKPKFNELSDKELIQFYNTLKKNEPENYNFGESELNTVGYQFMGKKRYDDAILLFELNLQFFPNSGNAYDSLAEAPLNSGDVTKALANYKKSLQLDPANDGAREIISKLEMQDKK